MVTTQMTVFLSNFSAPLVTFNSEFENTQNYY